MKGFPDEWRALIHSFVSGGSVAIKVNDDIGKYFQTKKGLRQGDPLSPILMAKLRVSFLILLMADCQFFNMPTIRFSLWSMILKGKEPKVNSFSVEQLSGLKINFHKSELFCFGEADRKSVV